MRRGERVVDRLWLADLDGPPAPVSRIRIFSGYAGWGAGQVETSWSEVTGLCRRQAAMTCSQRARTTYGARSCGDSRGQPVSLPPYPVDPSLN